MYLPGVAIVAFGSMLCALAPGTWWLVAARVVQGVGGAITLAAGFAVMLPEFPPTRRSTPIGIAGAAGALGAVVGPVVGSLLIDLVSWRGVFWVNVPLCLLVIASASLPERVEGSGGHRPDRLARRRIRHCGGCVDHVRHRADGELGARHPSRRPDRLRVCLAAALIRRSAVHAEPLIDLTLFRFRSFTSANIGGFFYGLGFTAGALVSSLLLQDVWDLSIRDVGLALAPSPLLAAAVSPYAGRWADRIGHRWILFAGCLSCAVGYGVSSSRSPRRRNRGVAMCR